MESDKKLNPDELTYEILNPYTRHCKNGIVNFHRSECSRMYVKFCRETGSNFIYSLYVDSLKLATTIFTTATDERSALTFSRRRKCNTVYTDRTTTNAYNTENSIVHVGTTSIALSSTKKTRYKIHYCCGREMNEEPIYPEEPIYSDDAPIIKNNDTRDNL